MGYSNKRLKYRIYFSFTEFLLKIKKLLNFENIRIKTRDRLKAIGQLKNRAFTYERYRRWTKLDFRNIKILLRRGCHIGYLLH